MEINNEALDKFLETTSEPEVPKEETEAKKIVENDGLIERSTLIEKKLIIEDGRQLLVEERPITHSQIVL
jgi:hypothetical protein